MARNRTDSAAANGQSIAASDGDVSELAEKLFVRHWQPQQNVTPEALASMCFDGAAAFAKIASQYQTER